MKPWRGNPKSLSPVHFTPFERFFFFFFQHGRAEVAETEKLRCVFKQGGAIGRSWAVKRLMRCGRVGV